MAGIWGRRAVVEALRHEGTVDRVFIERSEAASLMAIRDAAAEATVAVTFVEPSELDELSYGSMHQGVVASIQPAPPSSLDDLVSGSSNGGPPVILACDQIQDVGNLGALLRSLEAIDGTGALVPTRRSAALTGGIARASAGASLRTKIVQVTNMARALLELRNAGVWIYGLDADGDVDHDTANFNGPTCLVVGNEKQGIRDAVRKSCDAILRIRMYGGIGSLNVSVAGAIVMYHAIKSRQGPVHDVK